MRVEDNNRNGCSVSEFGLDATVVNDVADFLSAGVLVSNEMD